MLFNKPPPPPPKGKIIRDVFLLIRAEELETEPLTLPAGSTQEEIDFCEKEIQRLQEELLISEKEAEEKESIMKEAIEALEKRALEITEALEKEV